MHDNEFAGRQQAKELLQDEVQDTLGKQVVG
jgi:hypothetical protein